MQALFIPHGGGPLPLLGDRHHQKMVQFLQHMAGIIPRPEAIIVISAHWEAEEVRITHQPQPELVYDYYGFPEESYTITYPAPGQPELADSLLTLLNRHNIKAVVEEARGFDHGLFVPLKIMYPEADIPCIQVSLLKSLDARMHIEVGKVISMLDKNNLLVLGSGFSFHNLPAMMRMQASDDKNEAFQQWLKQTMSDPELTQQQRSDRLIHWQQAPYASYCHPREEHLLPLHVCYGAAQCQQAETVFYDQILNKTSCGFWWQQ